MKKLKQFWEFLLDEYQGDDLTGYWGISLFLSFMALIISLPIKSKVFTIIFTIVFTIDLLVGLSLILYYQFISIRRKFDRYLLKNNKGESDD